MDAYKKAGVNVHKANDLLYTVKDSIHSTHTSKVLSGLASFAGLFALGQYKDPVLVSGTDGVGTKLMIAEQLNIHSTVGIDLVAMCVNDIIVTGAKPLFFLDYFGTGVLDTITAKSVLAGIVEGCTQSNCALIGGETAELPGMYPKGSYDLAGFAVGVVERKDIIDGHNVRLGDVVIGIASNGVHSNGFSLIRMLFPDMAVFIEEIGILGKEILRPTIIYASIIQKIKRISTIKSIAHITGGGLQENIYRTLPDVVTIDTLDNIFQYPCKEVAELPWAVPHIFTIIQEAGGLLTAEMLATFNCGIGMTVTLPAKDVPIVMNLLSGEGYSPTILGTITKKY